MANRSYLFASASIPGGEPVQLEGLSECAYAIPLVYRLLVSVDVRLCPSTIWKLPEPTALVGRCGPGIDRLQAFLARIDHPAIAAMREQALGFLAAHAQRDGYIVLECAEILDMDSAPLDQQAAAVLQGVKDIEAEVEATLARLAPKKKTFWDHVFTPSQESIEAPLRELGLGYWSDTLYHSPNDAP